MLKDFEELLKYSFNCLKINRSHPKYDLNLLWYINCFIQQGSYTFWLTTLLYSLGKMKYVDDVVNIASYIIVYFVCSFKHFVLIKYKSSFRYLINAVQQDYVTASSLPIEEQTVVKDYAVRAQFVSIFWTALTCTGLLLYLITPCIKMIYYSITDEFRYILPIPIVYPAFLQNYNESIVFFAILPVFIHCYVYSISFYVGLAPLGPALMLHACGQLELMKMRMLKLFPDDGSISFQQRSDKFKDIAIHLQANYEFVEHLVEVFKLMYELSLKGTSLIAPVLLYSILEAFSTRGEIRIELFVTLVGAFFLSSYPCYYGDLLIEQSANLRDAVYMNGWEGSYERKTRSTILILMTRMERTTAVRTIFVTICLDAFADVMRSTYTLFSLLRAVF